MTRTVFVVFTNRLLSDEKLIGKKAYVFNCDNDSVKERDLIKSANYYSTMQVVGIRNETLSIFNNVELKSLNIQTINGVNIIPKVSAPTKCKRCVAISLEQAMTCFNSGDTTLKKLALSAYKESELIVDYNHILNSIDTVITNVELPEKNKTKIASIII